MWLVLSSALLAVALVALIQRSCGNLFLIWIRSTLLGWKYPEQDATCPAPNQSQLSKLYAQRPLHGKRCLITGSNRGLGLGLTAHLVALGADVLMACRSSASVTDALPLLREHLLRLGVLHENQKQQPASKGCQKDLANRWVHVMPSSNPGQAPLGRVRALSVDLGDLRSVDGALEKVADIDCDVVVLNAGVVPTHFIPTPQGLCSSFQVNFLSHFHFARELMRRKASSAAPPFRLVVVSSESHKMASLPNAPLDQLDSGDYLGNFLSSLGLTIPWTIGKAMPRYALSKLCLLSWGNDLFHALSVSRSPESTVEEPTTRHPGAQEAVSDLLLYDPGPVHSNIARNAHWTIQQWILEPIVFPLLFKSTLVASAPMAAWIAGLLPAPANRTAPMYHMFWSPSTLSAEARSPSKARVLIEAANSLLQRLKSQDQT